MCVGHRPGPQSKAVGTLPPPPPSPHPDPAHQLDAGNPLGEWDDAIEAVEGAGFLALRAQMPPRSRCRDKRLMRGEVQPRVGRRHVPVRRVLSRHKGGQTVTGLPRRLGRLGDYLRWCDTAPLSRTGCQNLLSAARNCKLPRASALGSGATFVRSSNSQMCAQSTDRRVNIKFAYA